MQGKKTVTVIAIRDNFSVIIQSIKKVNNSTMLPETKVKGKAIFFKC